MSISNADISSSAVRVAPLSVADPSHMRVLDFTRQLFGHEARLDRELDPETNDECFIVSVAAHGSVEEIVGANDRWHRGLLEAVGEPASRYRLSVHPQ